MLEVKKITKIYRSDGQVQKALDNVSINFRKNEFASILGPSGSGKTTFLNIIGGLDTYTSGDIKINEVSTKNYKDADWDSYRNHHIGFVFQSYNLIPHQTILRNVSLALTLSGIKKSEATRRAKKALEEVGLKGQIHKRPNQLSGGQMQRVAIARALVNNPDILLADEPTGALDSTTSLQIMNLLKRIAEKKLVIMVTHNPELAEEYSTRIINIKDGHIVSDTNPYDGKINTRNSLEEETKKSKKTKMSIFTSFGLSFNNLLTKKKRTMLVAIAGSIGIIGIALILALSNGFQHYVDSIEESTLTSYPLTIMEETSDVASMLLDLSTSSTEKPENENEIKERQLISGVLGSLSTNDLGSLKSQLDSDREILDKDVSQIIYNYSVDPEIYTHDATGALAKLNPNNLFSTFTGGSSLMNSYSSYTSIYSQLSETDPEKLAARYDIVAGRFPEKYDELMLVMKDKNSISDILTYSLGFHDTKELTTMIQKIMAGETTSVKSEPLTLTHEDIMNVDLRLIFPSDYYIYNSEYGIYENMTEDTEYMENLYSRSTKLHIVGIVTPNSDSALSLASSGIFYRPDLTNHIISTAADTEIVHRQLENPEIDVLSGKRFDEESDSLGLDIKDFVSVDTDRLRSMFSSTISEEEIKTATANYIAEISSSISADTSVAETAFREVFERFFDEVFESISDKDVRTSEVEEIVETYLSTYEPSKSIVELERDYIVPIDAQRAAYSGLLKGAINGYITAYNYLVPDSDPDDPSAHFIKETICIYKLIYKNLPEVTGAFRKMGQAMTETKMQKSILTKVGELTSYLTNTFASSMNIDPTALSGAFRLNVSEDQIRRIITAMLNKTDATAKTNLISFGYQNLEDPSSIYIYFDSFGGKENFMRYIDAYNEKMPEEKDIKYSDTTGILMSSVKTIVDAVTYVLIGFVSISLVVSSIMIGVITYISVYERTKEIGILRALGASKRNISSIFNAETFIIGLLSGILAIVISYLLIPLINAVIYHFTDIEELKAYLSPENASLLVLLSVILTLIGGFIPSRSASKKNPVESLRTE